MRPAPPGSTRARIASSSSRPFRTTQQADAPGTPGDGSTGVVHHVIPLPVQQIRGTAGPRIAVSHGDTAKGRADRLDVTPGALYRHRANGGERGDNYAQNQYLGRAAGLSWRDSALGIRLDHAQR